MTRTEAYAILTRYMSNPNLIKHSLAAEAAMRALYSKLNDSYSQEEQDKWGITGLLHDADYELAKGMPEKHGLLLFEKEPNSIPPDIAAAIKAHNPATGVLAQTKMEWAIRCVDQLTGLIVAATLVHPQKKIGAITTDFVKNRMQDKTFARGADRKPILQCEEKLGMPLDEFILVTLVAMQSISSELGL